MMTMHIYWMTLGEKSIARVVTAWQQQQPQRQIKPLFYHRKFRIENLLRMEIKGRNSNRMVLKGF
jgi:hypothetical protein